ncbi:MAG: tetratricopeptide repeat protein, partial [Acidobacteriota bacterium]|nr:tetratricopeptide repeat protein [Acidobacteriota bacterium]
ESKDETKDKPKGEPAAKTEPELKSDASAKSDDAASDEGASKKDEGGVEELRARLASASDAAERARLQRALVERLSEQGRAAEAVELLRSMLAEERFDPPFFYNAGNAFARLGESEAAIEAYRKAIAQRRGNYSRAQHNLGVVLTRLGRWEEAEEALTAALRQENYTYAEASYSLGRLHALRGEAGLAIAEWRRTLRIKPDHADAAVALARALAEDGDPASALAVLDDFGARLSRRGATIPRDVTVARGEIVAAANVSAEPRGRSYSEESKGGEPKNLKASDAKSEKMMGARASGVEDSASRESSSTPRDESALVARVESSSPRESRSTSSKPLRPLVIGRETYDLLNRAREAREDRRGEEAVALYRRAIEKNGGYFAPANLELGFTLAGLQRTDEAVAALLVVTSREPARYPIAFYHLGRYYEHLGRLGQADAAFARAVELLGDESPQFFADLSRVREREGKYVEALDAAQQYVRAMERAGAAPAWARERVTSLQKKLASGAAKTSKN